MTGPGAQQAGHPVKCVHSRTSLQFRGWSVVVSGSPGQGRQGEPGGRQGGPRIPAPAQTSRIYQESDCSCGILKDGSSRCSSVHRTAASLLQLRSLCPGTVPPRTPADRRCGTRGPGGNDQPDAPPTAGLPSLQRLTDDYLADSGGVDGSAHTELKLKEVTRLLSRIKMTLKTNLQS